MELYCLLDDHKVIIENQVIAKERGYPLVEVESAYDGTLWEKGYAPEKPTPSEEEIIEQKKEKVRIVRNLYLQETDFTQLVDAPLSDNEKKLYAKYRTYLRDYTNQEEWWEQNPKTYDEWRK